MRDSRCDASAHASWSHSAAMGGKKRENRVGTGEEERTEK
jgi:hypothetical protein